VGRVGVSERVWEWQRDEYTISTDRSRLDLEAVHRYLSDESYWAGGRARDVVERSVENSLCFGVYRGGELVAFARVVTDYATFAWLCDVFVLDAHRGKGVGKWLIETVVGHPGLQGLKNFILATRDAHGLYERYGGFERVTQTPNIMRRSTT
jgi:GNAT superfamily N-acetyltransferase